MSRPGDWNCMSCQHLNFQRRTSCQRCGDPKPGGDHYRNAGPRSGGAAGGGGSNSFGFSGPDVRAGDWYCTAPNCGAHNFASRSICFKCGVSKDSSSSSSSNMLRDGGQGGFNSGGGFNTSHPAGWKSGDWICTRYGCNEHNFASRTECYLCNAQKEPSSSKTSY